MPKNKYYLELKRYLVEVDAGVRKLDLYQLSRRVSRARQHSVPSLDICEVLEKYSKNEDSIDLSGAEIGFISRQLAQQGHKNKPFTLYPAKKSRLKISGKEFAGPSAESSGVCPACYPHNLHRGR